MTEMQPGPLVGRSRPRATVEPWPTENTLYFFVLLSAILLWIVLAVSIIGLAYVVIFGLVFFFMHLAFVAHVRGNGVRLGEEQFPELHRRVVEVSHRLGVWQVPETYVMQAGGALNAMATRFLGRDLMILYSDLLEACGDDESARDMIIGHELGHVRSGHLRWHWFLLPGLLIPFLGTALSRAREYTCDRYGLAAVDDREGALRGLAILAAGPVYGRRTNLKALAHQRVDLDTGFMTLGEWLSTHPPLSKRIAALDPRLLPAGGPWRRGPLRAGLGLTGIVAVPFVLGTWAAVRLPGWVEEISEAAAVQQEAARDPAAARAAVDRDFARLSGVIESFRSANGRLPRSIVEVQEAWTEAFPSEPVPLDPFDGYSYGYETAEWGYVLWSSGPDGVPNTGDDIAFEQEVAAGP